MKPFYQKTIATRLPYPTPGNSLGYGYLLSRFLLFVVFTCLAKIAFGQILLPNATPVTENFNGTGTGLPANWKLTNAVTLVTNATTAIGNPTLNFASTTTSPALVNGMGIGGPAASNIPAGATILGFNSTSVTMSANAAALVPSGGTVCFTSGNAPNWTSTANVTSSSFQTAVGSATGGSYSYTSSVATDRAFGFQGSTSFITPNSVLVNYRNTSGATMTALSVAFTVERYRINSSTASVDFYYSTDGSTWIAEATGNIAAASFPTAASSFTFNDGTQTKVAKTANITGLNLANNTNIYIRWNMNVSNANSQGLALDDVSATATFLSCATPANQPTVLTFPSTGTGQISGSFTAAAGSPTGYLVVRYPNGAAVTNPTDAVVYSGGNALGLGTVVASNASTSFTAAGLTISTSYDFYVYSFNNTSCLGGPKYRTASPLTFLNKSTNGCPAFSSTVQIDPAATRVDGSLYNTLTDALNDLSGCPITQPTLLELQSNYVSTSENFPLVLGSISGAGPVNTITIRPAAGASNLSISGASLANSIISHNGGSYWRVDGRAGGVGATQNLTIENTDNSIAGSAAVRFINGAQNNLVTYCKVKSSNIGAASGCINFSTSTTVGNSNNTVSNCEIAPSGSNFPNVGISSVGSTGFSNDGNQILNNSIHDFFNAIGNSYGVYISDNTTNWTISGNSMYETAGRTLTAGGNRDWSGISISPTVASTVTGMVISGNFIGGTAPNCGGPPMTLSDNGVGNIILRGIFAQVGTVTPAEIQGNTIQNISVTSSSTSANQSLISAPTGSFNIGTTTPNILGSNTVANSVTLTQTTSSTAPRLSGIIAGVGTPGTNVISNNLIGGLTASNASTGKVDLAGIYAIGASYTISGNTIGSTSVSNSLQNNTSNDTWGIYLSSSTVTNSVSANTIVNLNGGPGRVIGIRADGGVNTISTNTIRNSSSASNGLTGCIGIWMASASSGQTISGNTIHSLSNTELTAATTAHGIYYGGPTAGTNLIEKNLIHSLNLSTASTSGAIYGIRILAGVFPVTIQNNMVRLGIDATGADITTGYAIFGLGNASTGNINHYFNTLYVGGSGVIGTTSNTFALLSSSSGNTRTIQNNILVNTRDGGSTGNHYGFQIGGSGVNPAGLTMNYNLYQTTGSNGFLGSYGSNLTDLAAIQAAVGQNANSVVCDPKLIAPDGNVSSVDLHIQAPPVTTLIESSGLVIGGITQDFDGQTRSSLTPTDIGADAGNFTFQAGGCNTVLTWNGSSSPVWGTPANWTPAQAPTATTPVIIPGGVTPQPAITGTVNALSVTLLASSSPSIGLGGILTIKGDVSGSGGAVTGVGKVVLNGTALQTISGTVSLSNVDFANTTASGVVIATGSTLAINPTAASGSGLVNFLANSKLTNNGQFILASNALATASIGPVPASATFTGNVTIQRYIPSFTQGWYFLGTPIQNRNVADLNDNVYTFGPMPGVQVPNPGAATSSIFLHREAGLAGGTDPEINGWEVPGVANNANGPFPDGSAIQVGRGYRVFMNGNWRKPLAGFDFTGTPTIVTDAAPFNFSLGYTPAAYSGGGWNFVANPFPSAINWDAPTNGTNWTKTNVDNALYIWNKTSYGSYVGGLSTNGATNIIPSSQGFIVKANAASPVLSAREAIKSTATNTFLRVATLSDRLRITLINYDGTKDESIVCFREGATDGFDSQYDAHDLSSGLNIGTSLESVAYGINCLSPLQGASHTIPVKFQVPMSGQYQIRFTDMADFNSDYTVFLKDNLMGTLTLVSEDYLHTFEVSALEQGAFRFELVFTTGVTGVATTFPQFFKLYPNPSNGSKVTVAVGGVKDAGGTLEVTDVLGKVVYRTEMSTPDRLTEKSLDLGVAAGVYTVKLIAKSQIFTEKLIVR